jgi:pimeloyl-ACP methyl ester carboxylesterase
VILAGHSMGAIVVNRILREYPDLPVVRVQYLAAAASLADVESSVVPVLRRRPDATFEHATLHPYAEAGELQNPRPVGYLADVFVPRGSLLEWIDNYFENSRSPFDRRAGKWRNVALGLHVFPDSVRARVTVKAFGVGDPLDRGTRFAREPAKHGSFGDPDLRFWCRDFWAVRREGTGSPEVKLVERRAEQPGCPVEVPVSTVRNTR